MVKYDARDIVLGSKGMQLLGGSFRSTFCLSGYFDVSSLRK